MRRHHPDHQRDIPISMAVHWQLVGASIRTAYEKEDWEIAAEAIDEWVRRHDPEGVPMPAHKGYQWKSLFLPDGTVLRTVFGGKNHHCVVEGDQILYNGQAVSPSGFVNAVGGIRRNAWRSTWLLFPDAKQWQRADALRPRKPPRHARKSPPVNLAQPPATALWPADKPATDAAAALPKPAPENPTKERTNTAPCAQGVGHAAVEPDSPSHSGEAQDSTAIILPTPQCPPGTERRRGAPAWLSPVLRDELLLLLNRMYAPRENGGETGAGISNPTRSG